MVRDKCREIFGDLAAIGILALLMYVVVRVLMWLF